MLVQFELFDNVLTCIIVLLFDLLLLCVALVYFDSKGTVMNNNKKMLFDFVMEEMCGDVTFERYSENKTLASNLSSFLFKSDVGAQKYLEQYRSQVLAEEGINLIMHYYTEFLRGTKFPQDFSCDSVIPFVYYCENRGEFSLKETLIAIRKTGCENFSFNESIIMSVMDKSKTFDTNKFIRSLFMFYQIGRAHV